MLKTLAFATSLLALAACDTFREAIPLAPKSPQEMIASGYTAYVVAGKGFLLYGKLPRCGPTAPAPCSEQVVVDHAKDKSQRVLDELKAAEVVVRRLDPNSSLATTIAAAAEISVGALKRFSDDLPKAKE